MAMTLITTNTSSDAASSSFTSGIDNTYKLYIFKCFDIHPETNEANFNFQVNAASQSGYNETMTTTSFRASHDEADSSTALSYNAGKDQAEGTAYQTLAGFIGSDADQSCSGTLWLFDPSNTTYVKHFYTRFQAADADDFSLDHFPAGYINVTAAITGIDFKFSSGNMNGTIKMYGVG
jgi:hypothetical protein